MPKVEDHVRVFSGPNGFRGGGVYVVKFVMVDPDGRIRLACHGQKHLLDSAFGDAWEVLDHMDGRV